MGTINSISIEKICYKDTPKFSKEHWSFFLLDLTQEEMVDENLCQLRTYNSRMIKNEDFGLIWKQLTKFINLVFIFIDLKAFLRGKYMVLHILDI